MKLSVKISISFVSALASTPTQGLEAAPMIHSMEGEKKDVESALKHIMQVLVESRTNIDRLSNSDNHIECNTGEVLDSVWPNQASALGASNYVGGTRTWDTLRFAETDNFPLKVTFYDAKDVCHEVYIHSRTDQVTVAVPMTNEIYFYGDERDRVGTDAQTRVAEITFNYEPSSWFHSHGIRMVSSGYTGDDYGFLDVSAADWERAIALTSTAVDLVSALAGLAAPTGL